MILVHSPHLLTTDSHVSSSLFPVSKFEQSLNLQFTISVSFQCHSLPWWLSFPLHLAWIPWQPTESFPCIHPQLFGSAFTSLYSGQAFYLYMNTIALLFQSYFSYSWFTVTPYVLQSATNLSTKTGWCCDWDCIASTNQAQENWHVNSMYSNPGTQCDPPSIRASAKVSHISVVKFNP